MTIVAGTLAISAKAMQDARSKIKELIPRGSHLSLEKTIDNYNQWYRGWANYFQMTQYPSQLQAIEAHARRRMRSRIIGDCKRRRHLVNKLVKQGTKRTTAQRAVYSNKGRWALSGTFVMNLAYSLQWFAERGFMTKSEQQLDHWFSVKKWIRLT